MPKSHESWFCWIGSELPSSLVLHNQLKGSCWTITSHRSLSPWCSILNLNPRASILNVKVVMPIIKFRTHPRNPNIHLLIAFGDLVTSGSRVGQVGGPSLRVGSILTSGVVCVETAHSPCNHAGFYQLLQFPPASRRNVNGQL